MSPILCKLFISFPHLSFEDVRVFHISLCELFIYGMPTLLLYFKELAVFLLILFLTQRNLRCLNHKKYIHLFICDFPSFLQKIFH